jgi:predicted dehydrogenase
MDITHPHVWTRADILQDMEGILGDPEIDAVIVESWTHKMRALTEAALDAAIANGRACQQNP